MGMELVVAVTFGSSSITATDGGKLLNHQTSSKIITKCIPIENVTHSPRSITIVLTTQQSNFSLG